jgi:RimJ/RimL family protein N-acetyltransferase
LSVVHEEHRVALRAVEPSDLDVFFEQQRDPVAHFMVPFLKRDPEDEAVFRAHWSRIMASGAIRIATVTLDDDVAGHVMSFERDGTREVGYWLGRAYWGRGVATRALQLFLGGERIRPLQARVVADNLASRRVLEKCGFALVRIEHGFAPGRKAEVDEAILVLED